MSPSAGPVRHGCAPRATGAAASARRKRRPRPRQRRPPSFWTTTTTGWSTSAPGRPAPGGACGVGLGWRAGADVVRVLWPSGVLQAETASPGRAALTSPVTIEELNRKPSSCPFLYTWNGSRFEFVTDFMGGGEMGYWEAPGVRNHPDPDEYVRIRDDQLKERDGRYELRVTNELEEVLYVDRLQLIAIDHPSNTE